MPRQDSDSDFSNNEDEINMAPNDDEEDGGGTVANARPKRKKRKTGAAPNAKNPRGSTFVDKEYLLAAKAYMVTSEDAITGADQKGSTFWTLVCSKYNALVAQTNKLHENVSGWSVLQDRPEESVRKCWQVRLAPSVQKFAGICDTNEPTSGEKKEDKLMNMYYIRMMDIYNERATASYPVALPRRFDKMLDAYKFLRQHAKFAQLFPADDAQPPGSIRKVMSKRAQNQRPIRTARPAGRDRAKADRDVDFVISKVSKSVTQSMNAPPSSASDTASNQPDWGLLTNQFMACNQTLQSMATHTMMASAPSPMKKKYYEDFFQSQQLETHNQRMRAEVESNKLKLAKEQQEIELMEAANKKKALLLAAASVESDEVPNNSDDDLDDRKLPELPVLNSNPKIIRCSWPVCVETVEGKDVERCGVEQAGGGKCNGALHHMCQNEWLFNNNKEECSVKRCYSCWEKGL